MQNNKFLKFVKEKGYYIVLLICAAAVGVTGYFILRTDREEEPAVEVIASVSSDTQTTASTGDETTETTEPTQTDEAETSTEAEAFWLAAPVDGEALTAFAADHLAYNATTRDWRTHEGVDLAAELGQEVFAAADGTVYTIYDDENYGTTVVLRHTGGYTTHYANLSEEVMVTVGQTVSRGDALGTVGQTANAETATPPHLHFAVFLENVPVDPSELWGE